MSPVLVKILSLIIIGMGIWGLISGKIMAGSRGLQPNYYTRSLSENSRSGLWSRKTVV